MAYTSQGVQSTVNSTTVTLGSGATFTGDWERNEFPSVFVMVKTDNSGTLYFDFSPDGTNLDSTFPSSGFSITSGVPCVHSAVKSGRYFRVRIINDTGAQSYLRAETYYGFFNQLSAPLNQPLGLDADATLVRPTMPWLDISRGLTTGMFSVKKFGRNPSVGTSYVPITFSGAYNTPQSSSATTLRIKAGGSANDTAAGSGAREITLEGLDENFDYATEAIATAGAAASSATSTTFTRLHRAYVSASGTYATSSSGSHAATITIENGAGGTDWAKIDATSFPNGQTEIGAYSVAAGYTAYVFLSDITIDSGKTVDVVFFTREGADETSAPYSAMRAKSVFIGLTQNSQIPNRNVPLGPFVGPCDLGFLGKVSSATGSVAVSFEIFVIAE